MPISRSHAFATGITYPITPAPVSLVMRVRNAVLRWLIQKSDYMQTLAAMESFTRGAVIGEHCRLGPHAWCINLGSRENIKFGDRVVCRGILRCENWGSANLTIGDNVYIGDDCLISCAQKIEIGRLTFLAHGVQVFDNDTHPLNPLMREQDYMVITGQQTEPRPPIDSAPIQIGERVWIGFNAAILKGVHIGEGSIVAAGSVVTINVPPYSIVAGNPAKIVKNLGDVGQLFQHPSNS